MNTRQVRQVTLEGAYQEGEARLIQNLRERLQRAKVTISPTDGRPPLDLELELAASHALAVAVALEHLIELRAWRKLGKDHHDRRYVGMTVCQIMDETARRIVEGPRPRVVDSEDWKRAQFETEGKGT